MSTPRDAARVRLLIFSGRPDPEWTIAADAVAELARRLQAAREAGREAGAPDAARLGYRGFLIEGGLGPEFPGPIAVQDGDVTVDLAREPRSWQDAGGLEQWLLEEARRQGHGELLEAAGALPGGPTVS